MEVKDDTMGYKQDNVLIGMFIAINQWTCLSDGILRLMSVSCKVGVRHLIQSILYLHLLNKLKLILNEIYMCVVVYVKVSIG